MRRDPGSLPPPSLHCERRPVVRSREIGIDQDLSFWWLGQAGFLFQYHGRTILIDAYLSDALALKYRGKRFPHTRMMPPPILPGELLGIDAVICSHSHSDHMDPGLLSVIAAHNPACLFIVPASAEQIALERGVPPSRFIGMDAGTKISLDEGITITAIPAAHEQVQVDEQGRQRYLGFILQFDEIAVYHSGDCIPFAGLDTLLDQFTLTLALLPVNGRDPALTLEGIAGNFTLEEALQVMVNHDITYMIPHHFGMFDFNTVDPDVLRAAITEAGFKDCVLPAELGIQYRISR